MDYLLADTKVAFSAENAQLSTYVESSLVIFTSF